MAQYDNDQSATRDAVAPLLVGRLLILVFAVGLLAMLALPVRDMLPAGIAQALLEAGVLAVFLSPPLYFWVMKPCANSQRRVCTLLQAEIEKRAAAEHVWREREIELERYTGDLEMRVSLIEAQAYQNVELAEELAQQKSELEYSKRESDYLASHDVLTGLHNRRAMRSHLSEVIEFARQTDTQVAVMFIDLDNFKLINDALGHDRGDEMLTEAARALTATVRDTDLVARWGGDEFAIVTRLSAGSDMTRLGNLAERIRAALELPIEAPTGLIEIRATIGIAIYPEDAEEVEGLLACADKAMYVGKKRGRNVVVLHSELGADPTVLA